MHKDRGHETCLERRNEHRNRDILSRMLNNLHRIYVETDQPLQAEHIKGFQDILTQRG